jgi:hypothetical protein
MAEFICAKTALQGMRQNNAIARPVVTSRFIGIPPCVGSQHIPMDPDFLCPSRPDTREDTSTDFWDVDFCAGKYRFRNQKANIFC